MIFPSRGAVGGIEDPLYVACYPLYLQPKGGFYRLLYKFYRAADFQRIFQSEFFALCSLNQQFLGNEAFQRICQSCSQTALVIPFLYSVNHTLKHSILFKHLSKTQSSNCSISYALRYQFVSRRQAYYGQATRCIPMQIKLIYHCDSIDNMRYEETKVPLIAYYPQLHS